MEKSTRVISQVYGYAVCLVAVIAFLISAVSVINSVIDLQDPIHAGWTPAGSPSLATFENYKMDVIKGVEKTGDNIKSSTPIDEHALRTMYEAALNEKINSSRFVSKKVIIVGSVMMLICIVLFITHWRWMRKFAGQSA